MIYDRIRLIAVFGAVLISTLNCFSFAQAESSVDSFNPASQKKAKRSLQLPRR